MDVYREFTELTRAPSAAEFSAISLPSSRRDYLAKGIAGEPVFLLRDSSAVRYTPSIQYKHILAQFHSTCRVRTAGDELQGQFAVVACDAATPELHELFVRCFLVAVEGLPESSGTSELASCIQRLMDLFRAMSLPSTREISGLWAELFIIARSANIARALTAWHADQFDRFDFSWPTGCLEVKASTRELRIHEFALEQLKAPVNGSGIVASLLLQPLTGGLGVLELANLIEAEIPDELDLRQKLWGNIARALGSDFSENLDRRFDMSYAERNLMIFSMGDIPSIAEPIDPRISGIRYKADLSTVVSTLVGSPLKSLSAIFAGAAAVQSRVVA